MSNTILEIKNEYDEMSYDILFREHSKLIFKLINNFTKCNNLLLHNSEIDDIYQEVALKIFKNYYISKYKSEKSSFVTWLNIICRTTAIDYYRKRLRWMESVLSDSHPANSAHTVDAVIFSLPAGVLTDRQAEVITLLYREEMVPCEIAEKLGITTRTVRSIKFQALGRLRAYYGASSNSHSSTETSQPQRKVS